MSATCKFNVYSSWFGYRILFLGWEVCFIEGWKGPLVGHLNPNSLIFFSILRPICECNHSGPHCLPTPSVWVRYCWYLHYEVLLTSVFLGKPLSMIYKHRRCLNNWSRRRQKVKEICIYHIFVSRRFFDLEHTKEAGRQNVILKSDWVIKVMWNVTLHNVIQSSGIAECYLGPDLMLNIIQTFKEKPTLFGTPTPHTSIPALFWKCILTQDVDLVMLSECLVCTGTKCLGFSSVKWNRLSIERTLITGFAESRFCHSGEVDQIHIRGLRQLWLVCDRRNYPW